MTNTMRRPLGRTGIDASALGFGRWAIGGEWRTTDGQPLGWGRVDDDESVRAIRRALDLGVTAFEPPTATAPATARPSSAAPSAAGATRWCSPPSGETSSTPAPAPPSLSGADPVRAAELRYQCEESVGEGLIRGYAWSTDDPERAAVFAEGPHCAAVQYALNVLDDAPELVALCERSGLAGIVRSPLAMGVAAGWTPSAPY